ncbi:hypothetical protein A1F97_10704 [Pyrenophora tritici-repentis]|nr:hypothetical protein A1F95_10676 [Pyrenophora tritici-repentis]PZD27629.1 hypothetical protein A1F97_10704 [Pyrenophora tritici-repentis]
MGYDMNPTSTPDVNLDALFNYTTPQDVQHPVQQTPVGAYTSVTGAYDPSDTNHDMHQTSSVPAWDDTPFSSVKTTSTRQPAPKTYDVATPVVARSTHPVAQALRTPAVVVTHIAESDRQRHLMSHFRTIAVNDRRPIIFVSSYSSSYAPQPTGQASGAPITPASTQNAFSMPNTPPGLTPNAPLITITDDDDNSPAPSNPAPHTPPPEPRGTKRAAAAADSELDEVQAAKKAKREEEWAANLQRYNMYAKEIDLSYRENNVNGQLRVAGGRVEKPGENVVQDVAGGENEDDELEAEVRRGLMEFIGAA